MVRHAGRDHTFILLPSGETAQYPCEQLERVPELETRADAIASLRLAGPDSLERAILTEKVRGRLTDVVYSMETGHADFYPHQFRPVLKLVSSIGGRILIADEVGLGKTIEAIYIWKELQARLGARRLLIICPSMLQEKWQAELRDRFSIDAAIVSAKQLNESLDKAVRDQATSFTLIGSLEAIRAKRPSSDEDVPKGARQQLASFLANHGTAVTSELLDLVIIDEAHYLRNPATAANYLGTLLADVASHLVLLTATPIQMGNENLFQLLTLLDSDRYATLEVFNLIREANRPITQALNAILRAPPDVQLFRTAVTEARKSQFFRDDSVLAELSADSIDLARVDERIRVARALESRSLLADVLTRTRKRDVISNRVIRNPTILRIDLSPLERSLYEQVKRTLRARALQSQSAQTLTIVGRLRQLGSSIPAAISGWRHKQVFSELLWEDLGVVEEESESDNEAVLPASAADQAALEAIDSKYKAFIRFLKDRLSGQGDEKIVVFSFYRETIRYLERRLQADGVSCSVIMGGMGAEKHSVLARFADPKGPSVLLSSEIGSEGIDLQFARVLVNYDLPWNPMKVEQRIGRIDRLGQKSDKIHIINFVVKDTIEELVLDRLFARLKVFEESIGDLEEVLGQSFDELLVEYFRDGLTDDQLARRLDQNANMAEGYRLDLKRLEEDAPELVGHTDYILSNIQKSREVGRWIRPNDLLRFATDVLSEFYPGSRIERHKVRDGIFELNLSTDARVSLQAYIENSRPSRSTRCHVPGEIVPAVFSIADQVGTRPRPELIELTHPLILWLRSEIEHRKPALITGVAIELSAERSSLPAGLYVFAIDLWRLEGLSKQIVMRPCVMQEPVTPVPVDSADRFIDEAARFGKKLDVHVLQSGQDALNRAFEHCEEELRTQFGAEAHLFQLENEQRVRQAEIIAEERAAKRLRMLQERLEAQRTSDDQRRRRAIPLTEGQIRRLQADRDQRLARINSMRHAETTARPVTGGIILVR